MKKQMLMLVAACFAAEGLFAAVSMPKIFGNDMVLQQGQPVPVWGKAAPGEEVTVSFAGQSVSTKADAQGKWKLKLAPLKVSSQGAEFRVKGGNELVFKNVVVGEVWFCSGQSNMEFTMSSRRKVKAWETEVAAANWPLSRHFNVAHKISREPLDDVEAVWEVTTPQTIPPQSAVAYFFGETIHKTLQVPVGLINSSWGGTGIEPWTPAGHADDLWMLQNFGKWNRPQDVPTVLWNGMVAGLVPFAIKGAIWYQGCHNMRDGMVYLDKTVSLVRGWRREWGQGDFPYFLVQLAPYKYGDAKDTSLALMQEAQARVPEKVPNSGYTVINDVGNVNDIHPIDKRTVGMRMADQALDRVYGKFTRPWKTPTLKGYKAEGNALRVSLADAEGLKTRDGKAPNEFEVRGLCGGWVPAQARIDGTDVILTAPNGELPVSMRFAAYNGSTPNLVNGAGLPVGPFRCGIQIPIGAAEKLPELKDMTCVQRFDIPICVDFNKQPPPKTLASREGVKRVAYLLELQNQNGDTSFVMAAMDAFAPKSDDLVLTAKPGARQIRRTVSNLTVRTNTAVVKPVTNGAGLIEFYNSSYTSKRADPSAPGDDKTHDINDTPTNTDKFGYSCLQIHDPVEKKTIFAFNRMNNSSTACDLGFGSAPTGHPDWTFSSTAGQYKARRISVWVK